jgi:phage terminase large subunit GpA-like protein
MHKFDLNNVGSDWLANEIELITDHIEHLTPVEFNEQTRYLPDSVTPLPGFMSFDVNPFMVEIVNACDPRSRVREVNLKKGVQITYTTMLESVLFYYMDHVKTRPCMMISADKELVKGRIENYILPMLAQSDRSGIIVSSDEGNSRKTGKTANHLQWSGGGFLVPAGANNADKMRMWSIMLLLKDEIDAWMDTVGKDGDPDLLTDDRCSAFWEIRKIYRGGTPLIKGSSKIQYQYERGDQRHYMVRCKKCNFQQAIRFNTVDKETGIIGGFKWELEGHELIIDSVRYCCQACGHEHYEYDKTRLFALDNGAEWVPTAKPKESDVRSYHLPAFYSPVGMQPWYKCVNSYLKGFDPVDKKVISIAKYQVFYNNILAEPFEIRGSKVGFASVSAHRRAVYRLGEIPNKYAAKWSGTKILFLTCQVDVHKKNLAVAVMGWTADMRSYVIDYWRFEVEGDEDDCTETTSPVWGRLRKLIEETTYTADDGQCYRILTTLNDAGYANDTVTSFCGVYASGVYPILGRDRPAKNQSIREFAEFTTQAGVVGYRILVDHYKDRLAPVLRREWTEDSGTQDRYHFNAPVDITDKQLKELTVETRREETDANGHTVYKWHRPGNAPNELWDLLVYGHAAVEILAYSICIKYFELETIDWVQFWQFAALPENDAAFGRVAQVS